MIYSKKANNTLFQSFVAVGSRIAQFILNTDELIVFGHAVGTILLFIQMILGELCHFCRLSYDFCVKIGIFVD